MKSIEKVFIEKEGKGNQVFFLYIYVIIINKYILVFINIHLKQGCLSVTTGFMPSYYDNHQAEKYFLCLMIADKHPCYWINIYI